MVDGGDIESNHWPICAKCKRPVTEFEQCFDVGGTWFFRYICHGDEDFSEKLESRVFDAITRKSNVKLVYSTTKEEEE